MSRRFLLVAALVVVGPSVAVAGPSKAWTAAKKLKAGAVTKGIQEIEVTGESKKAYFGWIGKDVLVLSKPFDDRAVIEKAIRSKGGGATGKLVAKIDTGATMWFAAMKEQVI